MSTRTATAVIVKATTIGHDRAEQTRDYGPFLPHAGSATTSFADELEHELEASGRYQESQLTIEDVFIGADESDCAVTATR